MALARRQILTKSKDAARFASPSQGSNRFVILVLALQALAIPTHLLGMSTHPGNPQNIDSECPMHQDAVGDSGKDDSCECSGGLCSVGSASKYALSRPEQFDGVSQRTGRILFPRSVRHAPAEHHSIYQSRAPPSISLS
jgi:hypothetical protein